MQLTETETRGLIDLAINHNIPWFIKNGFNVILEQGTKEGIRSPRKAYKVNSRRELYELMIFGGNNNAKSR